MNAFSKYAFVLRKLGPGFAVRRVRMKIDDALGRTRKTFPPREWNDLSIHALTGGAAPADPAAYAKWKTENAPPFLFPLGAPPPAVRDFPASGTRRPDLAARMDLLAQGKCVYFFEEVPPKRVAWHENPFTGQRARGDCLWCDLPDFDEAQGDIRTLWEPGRAAWAIDCLRGHAHGASEDASELFVRWIESFLQDNPPYRGPHWKCGQEASVRFLAIALGSWGLAAQVADRAKFWTKLLRFAWATGHRVAGHIGYAISQRNNHAISEAVGLMLVAHLFPELRESPRWWSTGRRVLMGQLRRQIYDDGSYVQHSLNYQRVMLQMSLVGFRLCELRGEEPPRDVHQLLLRSAIHLAAMIERSTGEVPICGNDDGAWVLPLSECGARDFRPAVQAVHYLAERRRYFPPGPWDEDIVWLFGEMPDGSEPEESAPVSAAFRAGGYYVQRRTHTWAMTRCHAYKDRPAHLDQLHFDMWWRGQNVLCDAGTYQYFIPDDEPLERYFPSTAAHNTVRIEGRDPAERASRFLWIPWPVGELVRWSAEPGKPSIFEGVRRDYARRPVGVTHRRAVIALGQESWLIVDDLLGRGRKAVTQFWHFLFDDVTTETRERTSRVVTPEGELAIHTEVEGAEHVTQQVFVGHDKEGAPAGLHAPHYMRAVEKPVLQVSVTGLLPIRVLTMITPGASPGIHRESEGDTSRYSLLLEDRNWSVTLGAPTAANIPIVQDCHID